MSAEYTNDDLLPLSGIQHFSFCRRQWALIHIERQWQESGLTAEGRILHQRTDDPFTTEMRGGVITARALPVASYRLGLFGVCDVVEFTPSDEGVNLRGRSGLYAPHPVEYKRGAPKSGEYDEVQVCAQGLCLEEMFLTTISSGFLFYGEIRRRVEFPFTVELRTNVERMASEMHQYFARGYTPKVKTSKACRSCSLADLCLPGLQNRQTVTRYISQHIEKDA